MSSHRPVVSSPTPTASAGVRLIRTPPRNWKSVVTRSRNRSVEVVATPTAATITAKVMEEITIAASMLFAFDSAELSNDAKAVIDERIQSLKGGAKLTSVMRGRAHRQHRARRVQHGTVAASRAGRRWDYIVSNSMKLKATDVEVVGKVESDRSPSNDTREGRAQNRRVVAGLGR